MNSPTDPAAAGYPRRYLLTPEWRRKSVGGCIVLMLVGLYFGYRAMVETPVDLTDACLSGLLAVMAVFMLAAALRSKITLYADAIEVWGVGVAPPWPRRMRRDAIAGRRIKRRRMSPSSWLLVPRQATGRTLAILQQYQTDSTLIDWLEALPDLDTGG